MFQVWDTYISLMEYFIKMIGDKALCKIGLSIKYQYENKT